MLCSKKPQLPRCFELARLRAPAKRQDVRIGWMPQEPALSTSLVTRRDDPDPANGPAAGAGPPGSRLSLGTRRVYAGAWQGFVTWCASQGWLVSLPVPPERVVAFIDSLPPSLGPNGLKLRMAAIAEHHERCGVTSSTAHAAVRAALRRRQAAGEVVLARLSSCGEDLAGLRNRALLLVQASGLAPAEVAGIDREDLGLGDRELVLSVRPAEGAGRAAGAGGAAVAAAR